MQITNSQKSSFVGENSDDYKHTPNRKWINGDAKQTRVPPTPAISGKVMQT
jgi:hypothetical protein